MNAVSKTLRILIVRCDRLGDVLLSTPVFEVVKKNYPHARITVMVRPQIASVVRGLSSVDEVLEYDPDGRHARLRGFFRLLSEIRQRRFRIALVLQSQFKIGFAIFLAAIRYRVGPYSKIHSFLFYNRGVTQHRSQVEMHETDYNLQLLRRLGIRVGSRNIPPTAYLSEESRETARAWLCEKGWDAASPLIAVHPGMGGSALNWPESHYVELIRHLLTEGRSVLLTGGPTEGDILARTYDALGALREKLIVYGGKDSRELNFLAGLYSCCCVVVAPSTGPLHLAVALGKSVVSFYPPIRVQSAVRWGPYLQDEKKASVLVPDVYCGEDFKCRQTLCNHYPCMKSVTVTQALEEVSLQLGRAVEHRVSRSRVPENEMAASTVESE